MNEQRSERDIERRNTRRRGQCRLNQDTQASRWAFLAGFAELTGFGDGGGIIAAIRVGIAIIHRHGLTAVLHGAWGLEGMRGRDTLKRYRQAQEYQEERTHGFSLADTTRI